MTSDYRHRVRQIFDEALDQPRPGREAYLDNVCGDDPELRREVDELIRHFEFAGDDYLDTPAVNFRGGFSTMAEEDVIGRRVGQFTIVRKIGEGGMGVVYEAKQDYPRRTVALKVIRPGIASKNLLRRFEFEAEILGRLQHPGIAHIYEAGTAETRTDMGTVVRQPYFAMELIRGVPLDAYAAGITPPKSTSTQQVRSATDHAAKSQVAKKSTPKCNMSLSIHDRLRLVADICDAVQNAHQQGVIHRDLKPGNILVTDTGRPKVLDFGVARATNADIQTVTMQTDVGQLVGTVPYMSPEQVVGDPKDVDTRSDVYTLGVILFELLTGRLPHDVTECALPEAVRRIRDEDAHSASTINRALRGEIDTIVSKAIAKEKVRRYQSAADFASDIRRYLNGEPIEARADSTMYVLRKNLWRYRGLVTAALVFTLLLASFGIVSFVMAQKNKLMAEQEQKSHLAAIEAREAESQQRKAAESARLSAERSAAKAEAANQFLTNMLGAADPTNNKGPDVTVVEVLDDARASLENGELEGQEDVEASIHRTLGITYRELGLLEQAEEHCRKALNILIQQSDKTDIVLGTYYNELGLTLFQRAKIVESEAYLRMGLALRSKSQELREDLVAQSLQNLSLILSYIGDKHNAKNLALDAKEIIERLGLTENAIYATILMNLSAFLLHFSEFDQAEELALQAVEHRIKKYGENHLRVARAMQCIASAKRARGDRQGAEDVTRKTLSISLRTLGDDHPYTAMIRENLGSLLVEKGRYAEGELQSRVAVAALRDIYGPEHRGVASCLSSLATVATWQDKQVEAQTLVETAYHINLQIFGDAHQSTLVCMSNLAFMLRKQGNDAAALAMNHELLRARKSIDGEEHASISAVLLGISRSLIDMKRIDEAEACLRATLIQRESILDNDSVFVVDARASLGAFLLRSGRYAEAEPILEEVIASRRRTHVSPEQVATGLCNLGRCKMMTGKFQEAESDLISADAIFVKNLGENHEWTLSNRRSIILLYEKMKRLDDAYHWRGLANLPR